ncbi:MAG TPA: SDR family NAD(P)-dependent oxidoreductase [Nitrospiria bacterium]|nr:SDR family NAD(P)-dependent oxidoreductase [Nitrospiria bacterium]
MTDGSGVAPESGGAADGDTGRSADRVVLITGASSGIGASLAREFSRRGFALVLVARRLDRLTALRDELIRTGCRALAVRADVTSERELAEAFRQAHRLFGRIDIVVANAGFGVRGPFTSLTLDDYRRQFEINVFGALRTISLGLDALTRSKGIAVLMGSVVGHAAFPRISPYAMSKFALRAFADSLRAELAPTGVAVVLISPGLVQSEFRQVDNHGVVHPECHDPYPAWLQLSADAAARRMVRAIVKRRREAVITLHGKAAVMLARHLPGLFAFITRRLTMAGRW